MREVRELFDGLLRADAAELVGPARGEGAVELVEEGADDRGLYPGRADLGIDVRGAGSFDEHTVDERRHGGTASQTQCHVRRSANRGSQGVIARSEACLNGRFARWFCAGAHGRRVLQ